MSNVGKSCGNTPDLEKKKKLPLVSPQIEKMTSCVYIYGFGFEPLLYLSDFKKNIKLVKAGYCLTCALSPLSVFLVDCIVLPTRNWQ